MTPQEQSMLGDLVRRVQQTQLPDKDPDAQQLLDQQLGRNPDSLYVLAQTVLVQKYALEQAQKQLEQLRQQVPAQPAKPTSFLGSIFGHKDQEPAQNAQQQYAQQPAYTPVNQPSAYPQQGYPPQYAAPQFGAPQYGAPQAYPAPGGGSSFLRSAATTAAGVAAGALAFEGVESLMHGFGHEAGFGGGGGFGNFGGGGFGNERPEETVINNYYDEPRGGDRDSGFDNAGDRNDRDHGFDNNDYSASQNDDNLEPQVDQADDVNVTDDSGSFDDASLGDDSGGGDESSFV
jgi:hypothetical protein